MKTVATYENLFGEANIVISDEIKRGLLAIAKCTGLGLKEQAERAKEGIVASILKTKGMALIGITTMNRVSTWLYRTEVDGRRTEIDGRWTRVRLNEFRGAIPFDIIDELPEGVKEDAWVFRKAVDPIIAFEIRPEQYLEEQIPRFFGSPKVIKKLVNYPLYAAVWRWE